ncbi:MAG: TonB-dependent receptor plug domain-containing protein, partial [Steroidobacteraceae bacterium]
MKANKTLSYAILAILSAKAGAARADAAEATTAADEETISDVIVTAQRRSESIQDVPISIQALTADTLAKMNATTFDDFVKFLPNVTSASNGPGQSAIFIRGLSTTLPGT